MPRQSIHTGCRFPLEREKRLPEPINVNVVEERGELFLFPFTCCFPYALQRLEHANPVLCPERALLVRVPLGPCPWLHRLRCFNGNRRVRIVHRLHRYYGRV